MEGSKLKINLGRLKGTINQSSKIGEIPYNGLSRLSLSEEDRHMRDIFRKWLREAQLEIRIDDFGNMYGRREGITNKSPVVIGSHLDTQPSGGRFDGVLGVLSALEVIRTLNDNGIDTLRPIEIVNFTNEEGARFEPPLLGSGGLTKIFDRDYVYSRKDREGKKFEEELEHIGYKGKKENRIRDIHSFIELHIEQGPILENENISIGVVEGIQGMNWLEVTVEGESDHAGPTPMSMRKDALAAASAMILAIRDKAIQSGSTATTGRLSLKPDVVNCIPGQVIFSVDVRHFDDSIREETVDKIQRELKETASRMNVSLEIKNMWEIKTTLFHPHLINTIEQSARQLGYTAKRMPSGAGHDAKYMNEIAPTAMIFLPSVNGKSHDVSELTLDEDIERGANVLLRVVQKLANERDELT